jgi:hypothetical protein
MLLLRTCYDLSIACHVVNTNAETAVLPCHVFEPQFSMPNVRLCRLSATLTLPAALLYVSGTRALPCSWLDGSYNNSQWPLAA